MALARETCKILRTEHSEDDDYYIETVCLSNGGTVINKHPKRPLVDKEETLQKVGQMLLEAWRKVQAREASKV